LDVKRKVRFPGRVIPWVAPANSFGRSIGFEIGGLEAGEKIQNLFSLTK
jgi:hypothetical protein